MTFILSSAAFAQGARIPTVYTCDGDDTSPPLQWQSAPDGTRSFLIACDDPDAPGGIFRHWAAYDIPADWSWLPAGLDGETLTHGIRQAINDSAIHSVASGLSGTNGHVTGGSTANCHVISGSESGSG